jgi:hypothetical protein
MALSAVEVEVVEGPDGELGLTAEKVEMAEKRRMQRSWWECC